MGQETMVTLEVWQGFGNRFHLINDVTGTPVCGVKVGRDWRKTRIPLVPNWEAEHGMVATQYGTFRTHWLCHNCFGQWADKSMHLVSDGMWSTLHQHAEMQREAMGPTRTVEDSVSIREALKRDMVELASLDEQRRRLRQQISETMAKHNQPQQSAKEQP